MNDATNPALADLRRAFLRRKYQVRAYREQCEEEPTVDDANELDRLRAENERLSGTAPGTPGAVVAALFEFARAKAELDQYADVVQRGKRLPAPELSQDPAFAAFTLGAMEERCAALRALAVELAAAGEKSLSVVADAIMHGMPVTATVADARNSLCAALARAAVILTPEEQPK